MNKYLIRFGYAAVMFIITWIAMWLFFSVLVLESVDLYPNEHGTDSRFARLGLMFLYLVCFIISWANDDTVLKMHNKLVAKVSPRWHALMKKILPSETEF